MDGSRSLEGLGGEGEIHGLGQQEYGSVKDNRKR